MHGVTMKFIYEYLKYDISRNVATNCSLCASTKWVMTEMDMKWLGPWERWILWRIHGSVVEQEIWGIRS